MSNFIVEEIEINAPPERVFNAWTDPQQLTEWWGDEKFYLTTEYVADLRPGGQWVSRGKSVDGREFSVSGKYLRVEPHTYLSFTWQPSWETEHTTVELEFTPTDAGTLLRLTHSGFLGDQARDSHNKGWLQVFDWVKRYVEAGKPALQSHA